MTGIYKNKSILFSLFIIALLAFSCDDNPKEIFISPQGDNNNQGTIHAPLRTLTEARNRIREIIKKGDFPEKGIIVYLREGTYRIDSTFELGPEDSGMKDASVKYASYADEEVSVSGGQIIKPELFKAVKDIEIKNRIISKEARDSIVQVDLRSLGIPDAGKIRQHGFSIAIKPAPAELFIDHQPMTIARWPNSGRGVPIPEVIDPGSIPFDNDFSNRGGTFTYDYTRPDHWKNADDIWLYGIFSAGYADNNLQVQSIDTKRNIIKTKQPDMFGIGATDTTSEWGPRFRFYIAYNLLEEIDEPGEYYIDNNTGILYLYPPAGFSKSEICVSMLEEPMIAMEGASNIVFEGINFEYGRQMCFYLEGGNHNIIRNCTIRNFGTLAIQFGRGVESPEYPIHEFTGKLKPRITGNIKAHVYLNSDFDNDAGKDHLVQNCRISNTGSGAIILSGGNRDSLIHGNNRVENCIIHDFNRWNKTYCPAIALFGVGNSIRHCEIFNSPHQVIAIQGNEHLIEYNRIENVVKHFHDQGAIYLGRNPSERGNVIRYNYFGNIGAAGQKNCSVHLDDGASDVTIFGNIFYNGSKSDFGDILINGGSENVIDNNIFIKGSHTLWIENGGGDLPREKMAERFESWKWDKRLLEDIDIKSKSWKEKYPGLEHFFERDEFMLQDNVFKRNVVIDMPLIISKHGFDTTVFSTYEDNFITGKDPGFVNMEELDFSLKENAVVYEKIPGFKEIAFGKIGLENRKAFYGEKEGR